MNADMLKKTIFHFKLMVFLIITICILTSCFLFTPSHVYDEVKRIGINLNEDYFSILIDVGGKKYGHTSSQHYIAIYQNVMEIHNIFLRKKNQSCQITKDTDDFKEFLIFAAPFSSEWEKSNNNISFTYPFFSKSRRLELINIGIEHNENIYLIKKIGDHFFCDAPGDLLKGSGYFKEDEEYLIVIYPRENHHYSPPAITPIRFTIINGIPIIGINDY